MDVLALKQHGGWKSGNIAEGYVAESIMNKIEVADKILYNKSSTVTSNFVVIPSTSSTIEDTGNHTATSFDEEETSITEIETKVASEELSTTENNITIKKRRTDIFPNFVNNVTNIIFLFLSTFK